VVEGSHAHGACKAWEPDEHSQMNTAPCPDPVWACAVLGWVGGHDHCHVMCRAPPPTHPNVSTCDVQGSGGIRPHTPTKDGPAGEKSRRLRSILRSASAGSAKQRRGGGGGGGARHPLSAGGRRTQGGGLEGGQATWCPRAAKQVEQLPGLMANHTVMPSWFELVLEHQPRQLLKTALLAGHGARQSP
jgi:hypothetical protein